MPTPDPSSPLNPYWAALPDSTELAPKLVAKVDKYNDQTFFRSMLAQYARSYRYYFGLDPSGIHATSQVLRGGDQGELAELRVNHSRSLVNTLLNLIVAPKIVWAPKAVNDDYASTQDLELASALLEYYWKDKQISILATRCLEEALVFSECYVMLGWDPDGGDDYAATVTPGLPSNPGLGADPAAAAEPVGMSMPEAENPEAPLTFGGVSKTGDVYLHKVSAWDVIRDVSKQSWADLDWVIVRKYHSKFTLAAKYPDQADLILSCSDDRNKLSLIGNASQNTETDDIACYYFYHKRTPALPEGRAVVYLANSAVLEDGPLPYESIPLYRVSAGELSGTPFGYTPYFEVLGVQELMDSLHTAIATNQSTLATQCITVAAGSTFALDELGKGMRLIYHPQDAQPPQALQLTKTPQEVFQHLANLKKDQELLFGLNSVVRGEPQSGELSGSALALLQSQALQQSSTIQANYLRFVEDIGTCVLAILRKNLSVERKVSITGKSNQSVVRDSEYSGEDLKNIKTVLVEIGNPMAQTAAGRSEMAKELIQMNILKSPEQYLQVLTTGRLEPLTQSLNSELMLIRSENEGMARGEMPVVTLIDDHMLHAREHRGVLANPDARANPDIVRVVLQHISEHDMAYHSAPPSTLVLMGQQPPQIPLMGPGMGGPPPGAGPEAGANTAPNNTEKPPMPRGNPAAGSAKMPDAPTNPASGQKWNPVDGGL